MTSKKMPPGQGRRAEELAAKGTGRILPRDFSESKIGLLLSRLDGVRPTGAGRWIAKCPAHDDKSPSLSLKETDDGRVLLHCFGDCDPSEILNAVGLQFSDLFPERAIDHHIPRERAFPASDVLRCLMNESLIVSSCAVSLLNGLPFGENDRERLILATSRIQAAAGLARVTP